MPYAPSRVADFELTTWLVACIQVCAIGARSSVQLWGVGEAENLHLRQDSTTTRSPTRAIAHSTCCARLVM
jgi:hypothetical protein